MSSSNYYMLDLTYNLCKAGDNKLKKRMIDMDRKFGKLIWCFQESQNISNNICIDGYLCFGETGASTCILVPTGLGRCFGS